MEDQDVLSMDRIGSQLSFARSHAGMTIADVAALTKISSRYLVAIEGEEFGLLPSRVHALGFTRAFAKAVSVDEVEIVEALRTKLDDTSSSHNSSVSRETKPRPKRSPLAAAMHAVSAVLTGHFNMLVRTAVR